ncbi:hypothetical protein [Anaeromyxobacter oryzae]|uniref:Lipoprotein n=1 Tax=Anaeromyxobacter oryzae TaxID=2918170 RepID=A0ABM7X4A8_9BACT|nr:hypothetical protein [Anaeromyxobacter oryzae]BDG06643.1 hypothetical protein AMOR_56390 [Anaeromyxobacter oryzae]
MQTRFGWYSRYVTIAAVAVGLAACSRAERAGERGTVVTQGIVAEAGYTTFDATLGGCLDGVNGVNCNHYAGKEFVYMSGGPTRAGLSDGDYFFAVLAPGAANGGFVDGAEGNLSLDSATDRTFTAGSHEIAYSGPHALGTNPGGRRVIGVAPFADTPNPGGVYILAICQAGATSPSQCKFDAFRIGAGHAFPTVSGMKYYDTNANGRYDDGEPGIGGWAIDFTDEIAGTLLTASDGTFDVTLVADVFTFAERQPLAPTTWMQTGNVESQLGTTGGATATLHSDRTYTLDVVDDSGVTGVYFGNVCLGPGGGKTLGFWSNKNGQALLTAGDLAFLGSDVHLRDASGADFDPASGSAFRAWILGATATNMAYMLSAQLAAMELNVRHGLVSGSALVYAPGATSANPAGFATVEALMDEANASLGANALTVAPCDARKLQEALKNALDAANNDRSFLQPGPESCPTPLF